MYCFLKILHESHSMHLIGRRRELVVAAMLYFVGALVTAVAPNFAIMVVGRFIFGMGIGLVCILQSYDSSFPSIWCWDVLMFAVNSLLSLVEKGWWLPNIYI